MLFKNNFVTICSSSIVDTQDCIDSVTQEISSIIDPTKAKLGILFYSHQHNANLLLKNILDIFDGIDIIGGIAPGYINNSIIEIDKPFVVLAILTGDTFDVATEYIESINDNEYNAGATLSKRLRSSKTDNQGILFYDSVKQSLSEGAPELNMATPLLSGIQKNLNNWKSLAGVGLLSDGTFQKPASIINQNSAIRHGASLSLFEGELELSSITLHGCTPESPYYTITKTDGPLIQEIENKPAITFIQEALGAGIDLEPKDYPLFLTLGINKGELFDEYDPSMYANRLCLAVDEESGSLVMFEPDLQPGDQIQIMKRNFDFDYITEQVRSFKSSLHNRDIVFALYLDCIGRSGRFVGCQEEEASYVQEAIGKDIPLLGIYSGVEINKIGKDLQALDWSGVLCFFTIPRVKE